MNNEVKLAKVFRPSRLPVIQNLGSGKVFQVFVVGDYIYRVRSAIQIVSPDSERLKDGIKFLVMDIIVEFCGIKRM